MVRLSVAIFVFGTLVGVMAGAADEKAQEFVVCKNAKAVRTLAITPEGASKSCKVTYTKSGVPETVGSHTTDSSCHSILDHVRSHLESSKWACKQVGAATVTTSAEVLKQ